MQHLPAILIILTLILVFCLMAMIIFSVTVSGGSLIGTTSLEVNLISCCFSSNSFTVSSGPRSLKSESSSINTPFTSALLFGAGELAEPFEK